MMDGTVTTDLVLQAQAGDQAALDALVAEYLPLIYNIVGRALNGGSDVDDLVQDTMVGIIHGLPALREPSRFRSWAVNIAYRRMSDHYRRHYRSVLGRATGKLDADLPDPGSDFAERTVNELALKGQRRELAEAARWLEPEERQLFSLWWQETAGELSRPELAATIETTPQHAAVRLQRMRERLDGTRVVVRALSAQPRCPELGKLLKGWDGQADSRWRKRLARHTRTCTQCRGHARDLAKPEALLQGIGLVVVPVALLAKFGGALPAAAQVASIGPVSAVLHSFTGKAAIFGSAAAITLGGVTYPLWTESSPPPPRAPLPPASIAINPTPEPVATKATPKPPEPVYAGVASADFYVAPNGSDDAIGSRTEPFATLAKAVAVVEPGQTIALRGGTYRPDEPVGIDVSGTARQRIVLGGYRNEQAILDWSGIPADKWGITQIGSFWTVRSLQLRGAPGHAYVCESCHDNHFRRLVSRDNAAAGLMLRGEGTARNEIVDSDFEGNGSGLGIMYGSGEGNLVRGVRLAGNDTDGLDLGAFTSPVTVRDSWSYRNGNGFTLGGGGMALDVGHVLTNNAAWDNQGLGFNEEGNVGPSRLTRNTAFRNGISGFYLPTAAAVLSQNLAVANKENAALSPAADESDNLWDADASIISSDNPESAEGKRRKNGRLPVTDHLVTGESHGSRMTEAR